MSDPVQYCLSNDVFLVRGESGYLVFIMLKAREACELVRESPKSRLLRRTRVDAMFELRARYS